MSDSLVNFRSELLHALSKKGHEVIACAPGDNPLVKEKLRSLGITYLPIHMSRTGLNPFKDLICFINLLKVLRDIKPHIVLAYTIKPIIYGSIAAKISGIKNIYSIITGLGYVFMGQNLKRSVFRKIIGMLYSIALKANKVVFFQNPDDLALFRESRIITDSTKTRIINGSGVNLKHFAVIEPLLSSPVFLLIARILKDKGVLEYVEAAKLLKQRYPNAEFHLLGPFDNNPSAIKRDTVIEWHKAGIINYLGETDDVRPFISSACVFVLPSYREGTPRSVLEAMAMGRPIVTTDTPGCRETVCNGVNGYLVDVKDPVSLANAMEKFILDPESIIVMGKNSRKIAEEKYDVHMVNSAILNSMELNNEALI